MDDAGLSDSVDEAVSILARLGVINGISVMAFAPGASRAVATALDNGLSVSAHLDCPAGRCRSMAIRPGPVWLPGASSGIAASIEKEWRTQIGRLEELGAAPAELNSHGHVHHLPALQDVVLRLAAEHGTGMIRAAILPDRFRRFPFGLVLDLLGRRLARRAAVLGIATRASMAGFGASGRVTRRYLERLRLPPAESELVMHPAVRPVWSAGQPAELDLMRSEWFRRWTSRGD